MMRMKNFVSRHPRMVALLFCVAGDAAEGAVGTAAKVCITAGAGAAVYKGVQASTATSNQQTQEAVQAFDPTP